MLKLALILAMANPINLLSECPAAPDSPIHRDTLVSGDTAIVITTACAPICSSIARVYAINNKEWRLVNTLTGDSTAVFPEAYFEDKQLRWRDNTPQLLDEEGR